MHQQQAVRENPPGCRLHTIFCNMLGLIQTCDPKGSEQLCEEFLNFHGRLSFWAALFFDVETIAGIFLAISREVDDQFLQ